LFSLSISEGAINNILGRAGAPLLATAATVHAVVLASRVVCSDETAARVKGRNWWEWVSVDMLAARHIIQPGRGKTVVQALFAENSQRGHGVLWQVCLAHLLCDAKYAVWMPLRGSAGGLA
jgi:transposase